MENKIKKPIRPKYNIDEFGRVPNDWITKQNQRNHNANHEILNREIRRGLKPKWFMVIHLNDGGASKRQQYRRLEPLEVEKDVKVIKHQLYTQVYNQNWEKQKKRSKSIWSVEYGSSTIKPHINLIIEELPFPYEVHRSLFVLIDRLLPLKCRCLSQYRDVSHLQPFDTPNGLFRYITKESDYSNSTLIHSINDYSIQLN